MATRCLYCGTAVAGAKRPQPPSQPVLVGCPGCLRKVRTPPGQLTTCTYCALAFMVDATGAPRLGPRDGATLAAPDRVERALARLPSARACDLAGAVLRARTGADLIDGEADRVVDALTLIARPPVARPTWLPLTVDGAEELVPRVVLGVTTAGVERGERGITLVAVIETRTRLELDLRKRAALRAIDLAAGYALGGGLGVRNPDNVSTDVRNQVRLDLAAVDGGVEVTGLTGQVDQEPPTPATVGQRAALRDRLAACRPALASYYLLAALFGPSCRHGTAFSLTRDAIAARLRALACPADDPVVDALCIRVPPTFPG